MANQEHLDILKQGVEVWNRWREEHPEVKPNLGGAGLKGAELAGANLSESNLSGATIGTANLSGANLSKATLLNVNLFQSDLAEADLSGANLVGAEMSGANLTRANLTEAFLSQVNLLLRANLSNARLNYAAINNAKLNEANLTGAELIGANLFGASLTNADLSGANLTGAHLMYADFMGAKLINACLDQANLIDTEFRGADLAGATLIGADLSGAHLIHTDLTDATLIHCRVYGISAWDLQLTGTTQLNLLITPNRAGEPTITVDNLEVAQFIYLLLNNQKIREIIDTITSKVVLILGRFTLERKMILDAIKNELRKRNYTPVLFDFEKPASRDLTETVSILAHLARFIIVDLTDPSSAPHEVATVIPQTVVPVQPLLALQPLFIDGKAIERHEYAMFEDLRRRYSWVLPTFRYQDTAGLLASLQEHIIVPAELKAQELAKR